MKGFITIGLFLLFLGKTIAQNTSGPFEHTMGTFFSIELGQSFYRDQVTDPGDKFHNSRFSTPTLGIYLEHDLSPRVSIESGARFRNYKSQISSGCSVFIMESTLFQIPLRLHYALWEHKRIKVKVFAGINASFRTPEGAGNFLGGEFSYHYLTESPALLFAPEIGIKVDYQVNRRIRMGVFASYVVGIGDLDHTVINYAIDNGPSVRAISRNLGNYFQTGIRISYLLRK